MVLNVMNDIPLLKRRIDADINDCFQDKDGNVLLFSDVVSALKKLKKEIRLRMVGGLFKQTQDYKFFLNLFNEIIGKLPEEEEEVKKEWI